MAERAKHAFGKSSGIEAAIQAGKIDSFDILFLDGDTNPKVGWLDKNGNPKDTRTPEQKKALLELLKRLKNQGGSLCLLFGLPPNARLRR